MPRGRPLSFGRIAITHQRKSSLVSYTTPTGCTDVRCTAPLYYFHTESSSILSCLLILSDLDLVLPFILSLSITALIFFTELE